MNEELQRLHILRECTFLAQQLNVDALLVQLLRILEQELKLPNTRFYSLVVNDDNITQLDGKHIRVITLDTPGDYRAQTLDDPETLDKLERCHQSRSEQVVFLEGDKHRLLMPVQCGNILAGFLSLDVVEPGFTDMQRELIRAYLELFSVHFLNLQRYRSDALTGLMNRGTFDEMLFQLVFNLQNDPERQDPIDKYPTLALLDIDLFKKINDNFGHIYGDEVLLLLAQIMRKSFRHFDWLYRYGGEEFAVILHNIHHHAVQEVLERFRNTVAEYHFPRIGQVTVSIGAVEIRPGDAAPVILDKADKALYYAKNHGRNQSHLYGNLLAKGLLEEEPVLSGDIDLF